jgi:hypothetical protein
MDAYPAAAIHLLLVPKDPLLPSYSGLGVSAEPFLQLMANAASYLATTPRFAPVGAEDSQPIMGFHRRVSDPLLHLHILRGAIRPGVTLDAFGPLGLISLEELLIQIHDRSDGLDQGSEQAAQEQDAQAAQEQAAQEQAALVQGLVQAAFLSSATEEAVAEISGLTGLSLEGSTILLTAVNGNLNLAKELYFSQELGVPEPAAQEPGVPEPGVPEPAAQELATQELTTLEPATQEVAVPESAAQVEPAALEPTVQEPAVPEPSAIPLDAHVQLFITRWASNSSKGDAPPVLLKHITSLENAYLITTEKSVRASRHAHTGGWGAYYGEDIGACIRWCSAVRGPNTAWLVEALCFPGRVRYVSDRLRPSASDAEITAETAQGYDSVCFTNYLGQAAMWVMLNPLRALPLYATSITHYREVCVQGSARASLELFQMARSNELLGRPLLLGATPPPSPHASLKQQLINTSAVGFPDVFRSGWPLSKSFDTLLRAGQADTYSGKVRGISRRPFLKKVMTLLLDVMDVEEDDADADDDVLADNDVPQGRPASSDVKNKEAIHADPLITELINGGGLGLLCGPAGAVVTNWTHSITTNLVVRAALNTLAASDLEPIVSQLVSTAPTKNHFHLLTAPDIICVEGDERVLNFVELKSKSKVGFSSKQVDALHSLQACLGARAALSNPMLSELISQGWSVKASVLYADPHNATLYPISQALFDSSARAFQIALNLIDEELSGPAAMETRATFARSAETFVARQEAKVLAGSSSSSSSPGKGAGSSSSDQSRRPGTGSASKRHRVEAWPLFAHPSPPTT